MEKRERGEERKTEKTVSFIHQIFTELHPDSHAHLLVLETK